MGMGVFCAGLCGGQVLGMLWADFGPHEPLLCWQIRTLHETSCRAHPSAASRTNCEVFPGSAQFRL
eukprot:463648-Alexandrium_andersonii.AAC.1